MPSAEHVNAGDQPMADEGGWGGLRTASISMKTWIRSPTSTPPPSKGMLVLMPKSPRLSSVVAEKPARVPP
jgi:hypothetical protein